MIGRAGGGAGLLLAALWAPAGAASLQIGLGPDIQRWREFGSDGQRLLNESGRLQRLAAVWQGELQREGARPWHFALQGGLSWGSRDYRGLSSTGAALRTRADVRLGELRAVIGQTLGEAAGWSWHWHSALQAGSWSRDLRGVGQVQGYPERYRLAWLAAGLSAAAGDWTLAAEWGVGPGGRNRLQLPDRDPTTLPLGRTRAWQASASYELGAGWRAGLEMQALDLAAGQARPVTLQGVPVQSARQPASQLRAWRLGLMYSFF